MLSDSAPDLHVACQRPTASGADLAFRAERLSGTLSERWMLCFATDQVAIDIRRVVPPAVTQSLDTDGVLGLVFPGEVTTVLLEVVTIGSGQRWQFWLDQEVDGAEAPLVA